MSESGGFGGGFSGGDYSGGGGGGGYSFGGASESGTFGSGGGWGHRSGSSSTPSLLPALEGGILGYMVGRSTAPTTVYLGSSPASPYSPIVSSPVVVQYRPARGSYSPEEEATRRRMRCVRFGVMAASLAAFILYFFLFASITVELRDREQHLFTASSWFASGITFSDVSGSRYSSFQTAVLTFSSRPSPSRHSKISLGEHGVRVPQRGFQAWPVWLNRGSSVLLTFSLPPGADLYLYVIRGRSEFEDWKENPSGKDDDAHGVLMERRLGGSGSFSFSSRKDALYFFSLGNFGYDPVACDFLLDITSTEYDLNLATHTCDMSSVASQPCHLDLPFGNGGYAVLQSSPGNDPHRPKRDISVSYKPRAVSYALLLFSPWLALVLLVVAERIGRVRRGNSQESGSRTAQGGTAAQGNTSSGTWPSVVPATGLDPASSLSLLALPGGDGGVGGCGAVAEAYSSKASIPSSWVSSTPTALQGSKETAAQGDRLALLPSAPRLEDESETAGKAVGQSARPEDTCAICMESPKDAVILDCGHRATCLACGLMLQSSKNPQCPICRQPIRHVTKVYDV